MDAHAGALIADPAVQAKIERLARGAQPRVVDLFSGCGGISLGFHKAGFSIAAAIELDQLAARELHPVSLDTHLSEERLER
jgi:DNA (cytosine-5)-methyltransferase 1